MPDEARPALSRLELGNALRRLREERGMTIAAVNAAMMSRFGSGFSDTKLSRLETGRRNPIPRDIHDLCLIYDVAEPERARLVELAQAARRLDEMRHGLAPGAYRDYIELEQQASSMSAYSMMFLPGLLQTERYAHVVESLDALALPGFYGSRVPASDQAAARVRLRAARQAVLAGNRPIRLNAVIDEQALRRQVGGPGVMAEQLRRLLTVGALEHVCLQIVPMDIGLYPASESGHLTILELPGQDGHHRNVGFMESVLGGRLIDRANEVSRLSAAFAVLQHVALDPTSSRHRIEDLLDRIEREPSR